MIKLGKLTDYAVVVMTQLAREGASRSAHHLAQLTGLPEPTVAKVLKKLSQEDLVESARGAQGGYKLARGAEEISVCEIIEAMDGPIAITACVDTSCATETKCPARGKWTPVNNAIRAALLGVTVADMAVTSSCGGGVQQLVQIGGGVYAGLK